MNTTTKSGLEVTVVAHGEARGTSYLAHALARFLAQEGFQQVELTTPVNPALYGIEEGRLTIDADVEKSIQLYATPVRIQETPRNWEDVAQYTKTYHIGKMEAPAHQFGRLLSMEDHRGNLSLEVQEALGRLNITVKS